MKDLNLEKLMDAKLMDLVACGNHSGRPPEFESLWDLSCLRCAHRYEAIEKTIKRLYYRAEELKVLDSFEKLLLCKEEDEEKETKIPLWK